MSSKVSRAMMNAQLMREMEEAATIILAPPNLVSNEQRRAASEIFSNFKRTNSPYATCRYILEESRVDYVLFEMADAMKEALLREWRIVTGPDIDSVMKYLLIYVFGRAASLPMYVKEKFAQVIAMFLKRRSMDDGAAQRGSLLYEIDTLMFIADHPRQLMGCIMLKALVHEYEISPSSTDIGMTLKQNFEAKEQFELTDLKNIFRFCVKCLGNLVSAPTPFSEPIDTMMRQMLTLTETLLTWNFAGPNRLHSMTTFQTNSYPKLRLPRTWKDVILDNTVVNLFYALYCKIRHMPSLGHLGLTCLVQLASLQGSIFENEASRLDYLTTFIDGFMKLIQNVAIMDREAIGFSHIGREIMNVLSDILLPNLHTSLLSCFFEQLTSMTCCFAEGAGMEDTGRSDDRIFMEAFDHMTEGWFNALSIEVDPWRHISKNSAMRIFTSYVKCHIAFPSGIRVDRYSEMEGYEGGEEPDRVKFKDQLQNVGEFGRHCLEFSMPWLASLLEQRCDTLALILDAMLEPDNDVVHLSNQLYTVYEDLNWLLLISGSIISYGTSEIPADVMKYSVAQSNSTHIEFTIFAFMNPGEKMDVNPEPEYGIDPIVRLVIGAFRLPPLFKRFIEVKMEEFLSPELMSTNLWFLTRWATAYLMFNEQINMDQISMPFVCSFGRDSEGAIWAVNYLFEHLVGLIQNINVEPDVAEEAVNLFIALVDSKEKGRYVLKSESFNPLMTILPFLRFGIKRAVVKGLTLAGVGLEDPTKDCEYWVQILNPIRDKLHSLLKNEEFPRNFHNEVVKQEVVDVLNCMIGVSMGSTSVTSPVIFRYLSPVMIVMPELMHTYHDYQEIVELILFVLVKSAEHFVSYLPQVHSKNLYESSLFTIQEYSQLNTRRLSLHPFSEEDSFTDLLLIMELLSNLFNKDIFDFSQTDAIEVVERPLIAADVCLLGLSFVMPLVRTELLKYPELSLEYYKLISYICQFYPSKIMRLEERVLETMLSSIEFGLNSAYEDIIPFCCDFIHFLGMHLISIKRCDQTNPILKSFLKILMSIAFTHRLNDQYTSKIGNALFTIICCYEQEYNYLVRTILDSQPDPSVKQLLLTTFQNLMENVPLKIHRQSQNNFRRNFENFVLETRGFFKG